MDTGSDTRSLSLLSAMSKPRAVSRCGSDEPSLQRSLLLFPPNTVITCALNSGESGADRRHLKTFRVWSPPPWVSGLVLPHLGHPQVCACCPSSQCHRVCRGIRAPDTPGTHEPSLLLLPLGHADCAHRLLLESLIIIVICKFAGDHSNWSNNISQKML